MAIAFSIIVGEVFAKRLDSLIKLFRQNGEPPEKPAAPIKLFSALIFLWNTTGGER